MPEFSVLFVCLGNICRSPMAQGVFAQELACRGLSGIAIDSAGIGDWHVGDPPDPRAIAAAKSRDIDISHLRARQFQAGDFERFDIIAAMDSHNYATLRTMAPQNLSSKTRMFLEFARDLAVREVPDPYYGGADGFSDCLDLLEIGSRALADHIAARRS